MKRVTKKIKLTAYLLLLFLAAFSTACGSSDNPEDVDNNVEEMEEMSDEHEMGDEHEHENDDHPPRVPNEGAIIRIISPETMSQFAASEQIVVEIETENFELGDGKHWHVYIDGKSWGMVMGNNKDQPLVGLEPGEHEISVYLSVDSHEELEEGDAIMVVINE